MPPKAAPKRGKENAPLKSKPVKAVDEEDDFDAIMDEEPVKTAKKVGRPLKSSVVRADVVDEGLASSKSSRGGDELARVKAECERLRQERDTFAKQFEDLSRLRDSDAEALLEKFKAAAETKAKAQSELIRNQEALYEKQSAKVKSLEEALAATRESLARAEAAAGPPQFDAKLEGKSSRELRDEVYKLRDAVKGKDSDLARLQREFEEETARSRRLQEQSRRSADPPAPKATSDADTLSIRLFEDLTSLTVLDATLRTDPKTGDVRTYRCLQTWAGRNYTFRLCLRNDFDKAHREWNKVADFEAIDIDKVKDRDLLERLGPFSSEFTLPRDQLYAAWLQLTARMDPEGNFEKPN